MTSLRSKVFFASGSILLLFIVDRIAKWWALNTLSREGIFVFPGVGFILERNQGIAYNIPLAFIPLIFVTSLLLFTLVILLARAFRRGEYNTTTGLTLIIVGAFSNLLDRIQLGYVVDYVVLTGWPVFNIADVMILAGVTLVVVKTLRRKSKY